MGRRSVQAVQPVLGGAVGVQHVLGPAEVFLTSRWMPCITYQKRDRRRPDLAQAVGRVVTHLVDVAAGDEGREPCAEQHQQPGAGARQHRPVVHRVIAQPFFGQRLMAEQGDAPLAGPGNGLGQPVPLAVIAFVEPLGVETDEAPAWYVAPPAAGGPGRPGSGVRPHRPWQATR